MVTEVQSKMYLQGYYSMKDLSNGAGYGGWSLPHESSSLKNSQHFGMYLSPPLMNGMDYDLYEKEKLKQTIIKHESIFRHQVHELHRLYKKQRDLMNEVRTKEQSSRFSFGFHYEDDKRSWCASSFPVAGPTYGRPSSSSIVVVDVNQSPQSSVKAAAAGPSDLKFKKPQRRLFDLEVPAEEYIDEDESEAEVEFVKSGQVSNDLRSNSQQKITHNLADLNEPIEVDEVSASASDHNLGNEIFSKEQRQSQVGSAHLYSNVWCAAKQLSENRLFGKNGEIHSLRLKNESSEKECHPFTVQAGLIRNKSSFVGISQVEEFRKPGESSRVEASQAQVKSRIFGVEVAEGNNDASSFASKAINLDDSEPSSTLSWTKPETGMNPNTVRYKTLSETVGTTSFVEPRKVETPQPALPWLRVPPKAEESKAYHRVGPTVQDSSSTTRVRDSENRRVETSDCSSFKKILGFPIFDVTPNNDCDLPKSAEKLKAEDPRKVLIKDSRSVRIQIDLNECLVEEEAPPITKPTTGIDLEAPVILEMDSDEEQEEEKPLETKLYNNDDDNNNNNNPFESLGFESVVAAEALVAIASSCQYGVGEESLYLLADVISEEEELFLDDEFEKIILNLPETEVEECRFVLPVSGDPKEEEERSLPAPARRARRGQARRGRQRVKDFQSEVLPGLVTLSRNEVTEDLQTIEGLVRATGGTWQPSLTARNGGRSGGGRGRRRGSSASGFAPPPPQVSAAVVVVEVGQVVEESNKEVVVVEETSLAGWGKRTRRPPRQRCPISNSLLPLK